MVDKRRPHSLQLGRTYYLAPVGGPGRRLRYRVACASPNATVPACHQACHPTSKSLAATPKPGRLPDRWAFVDTMCAEVGVGHTTASADGTIDPRERRSHHMLVAVLQTTDPRHPCRACLITPTLALDLAPQAHLDCACNSAQVVTAKTKSRSRVGKPRFTMSLLESCNARRFPPTRLCLRVAFSTGCTAPPSQTDSRIVR